MQPWHASQPVDELHGHVLAGASVLLVLKERPGYEECAKLAADFLLGEKCLGHNVLKLHCAMF